MAEQPIVRSADQQSADQPDDLSTGIHSDEYLLDVEITRVLERAPALMIPADFAARVAHLASTTAASRAPGVRAGVIRLPAFSNFSLKTRHYGRNAAIVSMCVLLVLIFAFAHRAASTSRLWVSVEEIFCLQFALLAVWLVVRDFRQYLSWTNLGDS